MNNIALCQYIERNSFIHRLDPRCKFISLIILMIIAFMIPSPIDLSNNPYLSFIGLGIFFLIILFIILFTNISIIKYLQSLKQIAFIVIFILIIQVLSPSINNKILYSYYLNINYLNIIISILLLVLFFIFRKYIPFKLITLLIILILDIYILSIDFGISSSKVSLDIYEYGLYNGAFFSLRILVVIMLSTIFTLTTKPTDITSAIEWFLKPLTWIKINVSIFAMMISLALRFIPTLFNETTKILKAQASRGVDFKEGKLTEQITQIVSLLVPMFVVSYKRAEDLANAMEARGYIPGAKRTRRVHLKFNIYDYLSFIFVICLLVVVILWTASI